MPQNTPTFHRILLFSAITILVGYGLFNSRFLLRGPEIAIAGLDETQNILHTETKDFNLKGTAMHSSFITINNRPISVDESGNFDEKLLLSNGVSIIDVYAKDKFGKEVHKKIDIVYEGEDSPSLTLEQTELALRVSTASSSEEMEGEEIDEITTAASTAENSSTTTATSSSNIVIPVEAGTQSF